MKQRMQVGVSQFSAAWYLGLGEGGLLASGLAVDSGRRPGKGRVRRGARLGIRVRDGDGAQAGRRFRNWVTDQG